MKNQNTLSLKHSTRAAGNSSAAKTQGFVPPVAKNLVEDSLTGKAVKVQGKSPSQWSGIVESFKYGWLILNGDERRWQSDGSLSEVVCKGRFCIERSAINYVAEVIHD